MQLPHTFLIALFAIITCSATPAPTLVGRAPPIQTQPNGDVVFLGVCIVTL
jgi:hypothetical protein